MPYVVAKELGTPLASIASGVASHWKKEAKPHDAKFADKSALKNGGYRNPGGFIPGKDNGAHVHLDPERSAIIFGQAGTGKTLTTIANVKARRDTPDMIFCDPAGDILDGVEKDLVLRGYEVIKLDITNPMASHKYNPFSYIRTDSLWEFGRDVTSVCDLMAPEGVHMNETGVHFHETARNLLQSAVMHKVSTIGAVTRFLLIEDKEAELKVMARSRHDLVAQGARTFLDASEKEQGSIITTLGRKIRPFLDETVKYLTNTQGWSFEEKFTQPKPFAMFIKMGLRNKINGGPFARLVIGNALNTVRRMYDLAQPRKRGLLVFIDEARILENCQPIADAVNELRKADVKVMSAWHAYDSVIETYKSAKVFLNGCAWIISGGSNDIPLYKAASELAGEKLVKNKSVSKGSHESETEYEGRGPLVSVAEFQALKKDEVIVVAPGLLWKGLKPFTLTPKGVIF